MSTLHAQPGCWEGPAPGRAVPMFILMRNRERKGKALPFAYSYPSAGGNARGTGLEKPFLTSLLAASPAASSLGPRGHPGTFIPPAGGARGSWQSRLALFTPFSLPFPPLPSLGLSLPSTSVTNQPCVAGWVQAGDESVLDAVACCKCCTVFVHVLF